MRAHRWHSPDEVKGKSYVYAGWCVLVVRGYVLYETIGLGPWQRGVCPRHHQEALHPKHTQTPQHHKHIQVCDYGIRMACQTRAAPTASPWARFAGTSPAHGASLFKERKRPFLVKCWSLSPELLRKVHAKNGLRESRKILHVCRCC